MLNRNLRYSIGLILSNTKRSFEALGKIFSVSGDSIRRYLPSKDQSLGIVYAYLKKIFSDKRVLTLAIDDTLIQKPYSGLMAGVSHFFDTKIGRSIKAYRLIVGALTDGKKIIPINFGYIFGKEILDKNDLIKTKLDYIKKFYFLAKKLMPKAKIKVAADGMFASVNILKWCSEARVDVVMRIHKNRVVKLKSKLVKISSIKSIIPKGRQKARTEKISWHEVDLYLTAERRVNKKGIESIVYLIATYKVKPYQYVTDYKKRWTIEKFFRTSKQNLGLTECFSRKFEIQKNHTAAVILSYVLAQAKAKKRRLKTPEAALRAIKTLFCQSRKNSISRLDAIFGDILM